MRNITKYLLVTFVIIGVILLSGCADKSPTNEKVNNSTKNTTTPSVIKSNVTKVNDTVKPVNNTAPAAKNSNTAATTPIKSSPSSSSSSSSYSSSSSTSNSITVTDDTGRQITLPYPCERTVFLVENAMNTMYAVGGADQIKGIGAVWEEDSKKSFFKAIDPNYESKRLSQGTTQPTNEKIASVNPQVVFLWAADWKDENVKSIEENLKVPVYSVFIKSLDDLQRQMETFSKIIGKEEEGKKAIKIMNDEIQKVTSVTSTLTNEQKPTVYWMWGDVYGTAGQASTANQLIEKAGGVNVINSWSNSSKSIEHPVLNLESLMALNPQVIYMWYNPNLDPSDITSGKTVNGVDFSTWKEIPAVKNGRVYEISDPFVYDFHTPRLPLALMQVAKNLHPDKFTSLDLQSEINQYYMDMYNVQYGITTENSNSSTGYPITITDTAGKQSTFTKPVERVIVLDSDAADAMKVIGKENKIVGIGDSLTEKAIQYPAVSKLPSVGKWGEPNIEAIIALKPDVVLSYVQWPESTKLESQLPANISVVRMDFYKASSYHQEMENIGKIFNAQDNSSKYLTWYDKNMKLVSDRIAGIPTDQRIKFFGEGGASKISGRKGYGQGTGLDELVTAAGGVNIANFSQYKDVETEWVIQQNPETIFVWSSKDGLKSENRASIIASQNNVTKLPGFENVNAIKNNKVYVLTSGYAYGSSSPIATLQVAKWLYPDKFADVDIEALHKEYLTQYTNIDSTTASSGTFYYPDGR